MIKYIIVIKDIETVYCYKVIKIKIMRKNLSRLWNYKKIYRFGYIFSFYEFYFKLFDCNEKIFIREIKQEKCENDKYIRINRILLLY